MTTTIVEILRTRANRHEAAGLPNDGQLATWAETVELLDMLDRAYVAVDEQQGRVALLRGQLGAVRSLLRQALGAVLPDDDATTPTQGTPA